MLKSLVLIALLPACLLAQTNPLPSWGFDTDAQGWRGARHLQDVTVRDGILHGHATGHDPQLISPLFALPATAYQEVVARVRFSKPGKAALFYSNTTEGKYDGFSGKKVVEVPAVADEWQTLRIRPFWQGEKKIIHIRFDPPPNADVELDWLRIEEVAGGAAPITETHLPVDPAKGWRQDSSQRWLAPALRVPVANHDWLRVALPPCSGGHLEVRWTTDAASGLQQTSKFLVTDGWPHVYNFDLSVTKAWQGNLIYLDARATTGAHSTVRPLWIEVGDEPNAEPDIRCLALTPQNAGNRVGKPCTFLLRLLNAGGKTAEGIGAALAFQDANGNTIPPQTLALRTPALLTGTFRLHADLPQTLVVTITPRTTGTITPVLSLTHAGKKHTHVGRPMHVLPPSPITHADYVPQPEPAKTDYLIATYYYPGYGTAYQHRQMLRSAPWAKPALGYYDEGNPECIDWQIKWAVEHGVGCFLVDWYWVAGKTHHMHWLEGFRKARYRKDLKWAVMWANHNPPGTHSREDWRKVTQFWIDHYFKMPEYLRIDGKPVVAIWSPGNIRNDLGGSAGTKELLDMSQEMARAAGLPGIHFTAMNNGGSTEQLKSEGYRDRTYYHWWGSARDDSLDPDYTDYADVVRCSPPAWEKTGAAIKDAGLTFLPVADTGWDARPRHGDNTFVIYNRTPELFERTLRDAKQWLDRNNQKLLVLGPWNEWTEGSYIEPCAEYDFRMLEAIHRVFCSGPLPQSITPRDVGLGPYDFDLSETGSKQTDWVFNTTDSFGWRAFMGLKDWQTTQSGLLMTSTTRDPAIYSGLLALDPEAFKHIEITLQVSPAPLPKSQLVVFWETERSPINSRAHVDLPLQNDTEEHVYQLDLGTHPRWRGRIRRLRIDPCQAAGRTIRIRRIRLLP
jgi:hypothetical protein